jgi:flagellar protein FlaG
MNTVNSIGQTLAMDGHNYYNSGISTASGQSVQSDRTANTSAPLANAAHVAENIAQNIAQIQEDIRQIQKLSDVVMGRKVQFNVNQELNEVIVSIVDPKTNKVIKEIPSEDIQKLKVRIRKAIGLLFDEMI